MGEAVPHRARQRRPFGRRRRGIDGFGEGPRLGPPWGRGDLDHAAEQALRRAAAQQHRTVGAGQPEGDAVTPQTLRLWRRHRQFFRQPARRRAARAAPRAQHAARPARGADRGAEIHHRLGEVAGPQRRDQGRGELLQPRLCRGQRQGDGVEPSDDALDIAVDRRHRTVERDRRDRRRGVAADARERTQRRGLAREYAAVTLDHGAGAGMQIAGARVIAEPLPHMQDRVERGRRERRNIGPARYESFKIGSDGRHHRLLQHDLAEPDMVGIGPNAGASPPRQVSTLMVVPGEQIGRIGPIRRIRQFGSGQIGADR